MLDTIAPEPVLPLHLHNVWRKATSLRRVPKAAHGDQAEKRGTIALPVLANMAFCANLMLQTHDLASLTLRLSLGLGLGVVLTGVETH